VTETHNEEPKRRKAENRVIIKGVKEGLVFLLDDTCPFSDVLDELTHKLEKTHRNILAGPIIPVQIKTGQRRLGDSETEQLRSVIGRIGNLHIVSIESERGDDKPAGGRRAPVTVMRGIVRSGQTIRHDGNLLYLGDVNPGGTILCTGDIFVLGALRGVAHAGVNGDETSVIAAAYMRPTQLRIAGVISRPPDEWGVGETYMEFAYIQDGKMEIDKISQLHRVRPELF